MDPRDPHPHLLILGLAAILIGMVLDARYARDESTP